MGEAFKVREMKWTKGVGFHPSVRTQEEGKAEAKTGVANICALRKMIYLCFKCAFQMLSRLYKYSA